MISPIFFTDGYYSKLHCARILILPSIACLKQTIMCVLFQIFGTDVLQDWAVPQQTPSEVGSELERAALRNEQEVGKNVNVKPNDAES